MIKTLILLLFNPKILLSIGSIFLSVGSYALLYGWRFAVGLVGLILVHEMGHYLAAVQKKLKVGLPIFLPFMGAYVDLKENPASAETEAYVAYAGPFVGTFAAFACYYWGRAYDDALAMALAQTGFILNLFNLIPISPLDGGRITSVLSPRIWFLGIPIMIGVWLYQPSPILILVAVSSVPQLITAWHYDKNAPDNRAYYQIKPAVKFEYTALYLILVIVLALMIHSLHGGMSFSP